MRGQKTIAYLREITDLGEFQFIFSKKKKIQDNDKTTKFYMEASWCPVNYSIINSIVGYNICDIDEEIKKLESKGGMQYFLDGAKITCESAIENETDDDGVYGAALINFFGWDEELIEKVRLRSY